MSRAGYEQLFRVRDVVIAGAALLVLAPVIGAVAISVRIALGSPVLFAQVRPGLHGHPFTLFKFRSMRPYDPSRGLADDDDRLTRFGRALRASSLDELPELVNVIRGDMSLVGPRPLLLEYLGRYTSEQARRHDLRPGLTGWAQVQGRNALTWEQKLALDVWYVDNRSLGLDVRILAKTLGVVLRRVGIHADAHATAPPFTGSPANTSSDPSGTASRGLS